MAIIRIFLVVVIAIGIGVNVAGAQEFPTKRITMIVPYPPGGLLDLATRIIAEHMSSNWGHNVIVENKPGGSTIIGTQEVAKAKPDGYTIGVVANSFTVNPTLKKQLPYDTLTDFAPVTLVASAPHVLVINSSLPAKSLQTLIALAKSEPGKLTASSSGAGSATHLSIEMLKTATGIDILHVPYKGGPPAVIAVLGHEVDMTFQTVVNVLPYIRSGKLRALGVASKKRLALLPDVPTFEESGLGGFEASSWVGMIVPKGTPEELIDKINKEVVRILNLPNVQKALADQGFEIDGTSPAAFGAFIQSELKRNATLLRSLKLKGK
jgi:tripartite-type tricarboxylate transporter receptor subunit TctC